MNKRSRNASREYHHMNLSVNCCLKSYSREKFIGVANNNNNNNQRLLSLAVNSHQSNDELT